MNSVKLLIVTLLGMMLMQSCSEQESNLVDENLTQEELLAEQRRANTIAQLQTLDISQEEMQEAITAINADQSMVKEEMRAIITAEGLNPDDIFSLTSEEIVNNANKRAALDKNTEVKGDLKATFEDCENARDSYVKYFFGSTSVLTTMDHVILRQLNYQESGNYSFATKWNYENGGLTTANAESITEISANTVIYTYTTDGDAIHEYLVGGC